MSTKVKKETPDEVHERVFEMLHTRGIEVAINGLIAVAEDPKAPAPARATAGAALLRSAGFFDRDRDDLSDKKPSEMSPEELSRALQRLKRELADKDARKAIEHVGGDGASDGSLFD
ncbi:hypothetical protein [Mesorhizobium marinum]|uniref:hypothetical protein n=1 Tax=Mesorhizobium marinum TaxID=3228790 RepID=UPI003465F52F